MIEGCLNNAAGITFAFIFPPLNQNRTSAVHPWLTADVGAGTNASSKQSGACSLKRGSGQAGTLARCRSKVGDDNTGRVHHFDMPLRLQVGAIDL